MDKYIKQTMENPNTIRELKEWRESTKGMSLEEKIDLVLNRNKEAINVKN